MTTSAELIAQAARQGQTSVQLADGDAAIIKPAEMFPDAICNHGDCTAVFDSHTGQWTNGRADNRTLIEKRDQWCFGLCPKHRDRA